MTWPWLPSLWCKSGGWWPWQCGAVHQPDHHSMHLKGDVVFCKSTIPLCLNAVIVMSPHSLGAVTDPFQLSLSPEVAIAEPKGSS